MLEALEKYTPSDAEKNHWSDIRALIENHLGCFDRTYFNPGHITGSALLVSADGSCILMNHHKFLNIWICFGGHADGETDILNVARREVIEESGIADIEPVITDIFDVDIHPIPFNAKKNEPPHKHFDIRYLFRVRNVVNENFALSDESCNLRWCSYEEARKLASHNDAGMHRLLDKWHEYYVACGQMPGTVRNRA
jgi:8-oxo-dGTP pyrophosphatase MutT (NUDIX family)